MQVRTPYRTQHTCLPQFAFVEYKEAFALFDKRGTGAVPRETLGDLLRALGQNPTQAEVAEIVGSAPRDGEHSHYTSFCPMDDVILISLFPLVDYNTFLKILNRPDGFKPAGTPGKLSCLNREFILH